MDNNAPQSVSLGSSATRNSAFPWLLPLMVVAVLLVAAGFIGRVTADGNDPKNLLGQVTQGPRIGIVADNIGDEVCMFLIKENGVAENRKSCVPRKQALNLGKPFEELPAVELEQGSGLFRITRDTRYGVSDGAIFESIDQLPPPPPEPTVEPKEQPTQLPSTGGS